MLQLTRPGTTCSLLGPARVFLGGGGGASKCVGRAANGQLRGGWVVLSMFVRMRVLGGGEGGDQLPGSERHSMAAWGWCRGGIADKCSKGTVCLDQQVLVILPM